MAEPSTGRFERAESVLGRLERHMKAVEEKMKSGEWQPDPDDLKDFCERLRVLTDIAERLQKIALAGERSRSASPR